MVNVLAAQKVRGKGRPKMAYSGNF